MPLHPLWRPFEQVSEDNVRSARVDGGRHMPASVHVDVVDPDPSWPLAYARLEKTIRSALGDEVHAVRHVGSTSVAGLAAKPVIDIDLLVANSADESSYVPALTAAGFRLAIREPEWEEHRALVFDDPRCNLHVFSVGAIEPQRHLLFREWLTTHDDDRARYGALKLRLAAREWSTVMEYNNAKGRLIYDIYERIFVADAAHMHDTVAADESMRRG